MYVYLPVFHDLKLTSTYQVRGFDLIPQRVSLFKTNSFSLQYLQMRFDNRMRMFGGILFIFSQVRNRLSSESTDFESSLLKKSLTPLTKALPLFTRNRKLFKRELDSFVVFILQMTWLPIVIFVPALAFNQGSYSREFARTFNSPCIDNKSLHNSRA